MIVHQFQGSIHKLSRATYLDQLDGSLKPYSGTRNNLIERLNTTYELTESEYVNLVLRGDKDHYLKCLNCNSNLHHKLVKSGRPYCNQSCQISAQQKQLHKEGRHPINHSDNSIEIRSKLSAHASLQMQNGTHALQFLDSKNKAERERFISQFTGRGLRAHLYVTYFDYKIKFGITTSKYGRKHDNRRPLNGFYKSMHILRSSDKIDRIAELEYQIKSDFWSSFKRNS